MSTQHAARHLLHELLLWVEFRSSVFQLFGEGDKNVGGLVLELCSLKELEDFFLRFGHVYVIHVGLVLVVVKYVHDLLEFVLLLLD